MSVLGRTGFPKVFDGEHFFYLEETKDHNTLVTNVEVYSGVLSLIINTLPMMKSAPQGFQKMNLELKAYLENK